MITAIDTKPKNNFVFDAKPNNSAFDVRPSQVSADMETVAYLDTKNISKGESMGLLLSLTYPSNLTFTTARL